MWKKLCICFILLLTACTRSYELGHIYDFDTIKEQGYINGLGVPQVTSLLNLPKDVMNEMNTYTLLVNTINHPYFGGISFAKTINSGFEHFREDFNGARELLLREDFIDAYIYATNNIEEVRNAMKPYEILTIRYLQYLLHSERVQKLFEIDGRYDVEKLLEKLQKIQEEYDKAYEKEHSIE